MASSTVVLVRFPRGDDAAADGNAFDAARAQCVDERLRGPLAEQAFLARRGPVDERAILSDDALEQIEAIEDGLQVVDLATCDHDEAAS